MGSYTFRWYVGRHIRKPPCALQTHLGPSQSASELDFWVELPGASASASYQGSQGRLLCAVLPCYRATLPRGALENFAFALFFAVSNSQFAS